MRPASLSPTSASGNGRCAGGDQGLDLEPPAVLVVVARVERPAARRRVLRGLAGDPQAAEVVGAADHASIRDAQPHALAGFVPVERVPGRVEAERLEAAARHVRRVGDGDGVRAERLRRGQGVTRRGDRPGGPGEFRDRLLWRRRGAPTRVELRHRAGDLHRVAHRDGGRRALREHEQGLGGGRVVVGVRVLQPEPARRAEPAHRGDDAGQAVHRLARVRGEARGALHVVDAERGGSAAVAAGATTTDRASAAATAIGRRNVTKPPGGRVVTRSKTLMVNGW